MAINTITSSKNPHLAAWKTLRSDRQERQQQGRFLVVGRLLVEEAQKQKRIETLLVAPSLAEIASKGERERFILSEHLFAPLTNQPSPEGIAAIVKIERPRPLQENDCVLVLDRLQDPGNVGNLWRSAAAFGWRVLFIRGGCDPYHERVISASRGAVFSEPPLEYEEVEFLSLPIEAPVLHTDASGASIEEWRAKNSLERGAFLILGREGSGITLQHPQAQRVAIPMQEGTESLNVATAGGIFMYLLMQRIL